MTVKVTLNLGHGMNYHSHERHDEVWTVRLFNITESGATVSAFFYSLVESCKVLGIRFKDYMTHVMLKPAPSKTVTKKHGRQCCLEDVTSPMPWPTENSFSLLCRILKGLNLTGFVENVSETIMI